MCAEPFKRGVSVSHSSFGLLDISPCGFQIQTFWMLSHQCRCQKVWVPDVGLESLTPQALTLWLWFPFPLWVAALGWGFWWDYIHASPTPLHVVFISFVGGAIQQVFRSFLERIIYVTVNLVYLRGCEFRVSCATILNFPLSFAFNIKIKCWAG